MTQAVTDLLAEIERLSPPERVEFCRAVVERIPMSDDLTDDDFAALASDMFRTLDVEKEPTSTPLAASTELGPQAPRHRVDPTRNFRYSLATGSLGYTFWQDVDGWLGYLDTYPDYMTQGTSLEDLKEHLLDLYRDLSSGAIPAVRQHAELEVA